MEEELTKKEKRELAKEEKNKERSRQGIASKTKKIILVALILGAVAFLGYKLVSYINTPTPSAGEPLTVSEGDWVKGEKSAQVVLVEYADFQCPACAAYGPLVDRLLGDFPGELLMIYRNFPLISIHKNAMASAQTAEAAGKQGKYWEMNKLLYERQEEWSEAGGAKEKFVEYAKELGLNQESFLADYDSQAVKDKISADILSGQKLRVSYTPSFFLNGRLISPKSYEQFQSLVEEEVAK